MKKLSVFLHFDCQSFLEGKQLQALSQKDWVNFETKNVLGTVVEAVIVEDHTDYHLKPGEQVTNLFEKMNVKVAKTGVRIPVGAKIELVNPVGTVYGDYRNQLSIRCDDIRITQPSAQRRA